MDTTLVRRAVIHTLSFFALFEYPLTASELARWLMSAESVSAGALYCIALTYAAEEGSPIGFENGFFFVRGHKASVERRTKNFLSHLPKFERARRAARLIAWIPFLRMAAVCNTVAMAASQAESDIDFFIIARARRLWTVRMLTVLMLQAAGLRRHGAHIANRICLSFYATDTALDISSMRLPHGDVYLTYWPAQLVLLFDENDTYKKFVRSNTWVRDALPHVDFESAESDTRRVPCGGASGFFRRRLERVLGGRCGNAVERVCRFVQRAKMARAPHGTRPVENAVVISDTMLKFHERDRRQEFQARWEELIHELSTI